MEVVRTPEPPSRRHDDPLDWKRRVPKWVYLAGWVIGAVIIGWLAGRLQVAWDKEAKRIEAAVLEAPTNYQARLSERVAVVEEQQAQLRESLKTLNVDVRTLSGAITEQTTQLRLLTAELKQVRKEE